MDSWLDSWRAFLMAHEGVVAYLLLGASGAVEYVVPPFPGDVLAVFGIFLAVTADYNLPLVYLMLNIGSTLGGLVAYGGGRWMRAAPSAWPAWLQQGWAHVAIEVTLRRFQRHGGWYLLVNRFVPVLRSFFFLTAGLVAMPIWRVAVLGFLSAALWNLLLLAIGVFAGKNWRVVELYLQRYTLISISVMALGVTVWLLWRWRQRRAERLKSASTDATSDPTSSAKTVS